MARPWGWKVRGQGQGHYIVEHFGGGALFDRQIYFGKMEERDPTSSSRTPHYSLHVFTQPRPAAPPN